MISLEREIRKYNILAYMAVRGEGSLHCDRPNRTLWDICGKPTVQWTVEAAKGSKYIDKIAVATESEEIKKVLRKIEGIVLIDRPLWTSLDMPRDYTRGEFERKKPRSIQSQEAIVYSNPSKYMLYYLEQTEGYIPDISIGFCADSPLVTSQTFDRLIIKFFEDESIGCISCMYPIPFGLVMINPITGGGVPFYVLPKGLDRQECPPLFCQAVPSLLGSPSKVESSPSTGKEEFIEISIEEGLDVHNQEDLFLARCYMSRRLEKEKNKNKEEVKS